MKWYLWDERAHYPMKLSVDSPVKHKNAFKASCNNSNMLNRTVFTGKQGSYHLALRIFERLLTAERAIIKSHFCSIKAYQDGTAHFSRVYSNVNMMSCCIDGIINKEPPGRDNG